MLHRERRHMMLFQSRFRTLCLAALMCPVAAGTATAQSSPAAGVAEPAVFTATEPHREVKDGKVIRYSDIKRLARARSFDFEPTTIDFNPDFNTKSLRGNIVMRWEYVRGSTLFVVWDMSQADTTRAGQFSPFRDLQSAFGADANHVVMVKAAYWFNR